MIAATPKEIETRLAEFRRDPAQLLALCIWREARGETQLARVGVGKTVTNRCAIAPAQGFGHTIDTNVLKPYAFSSFNRGDVNASKFPFDLDSTWQACQLAAKAAIDASHPDPTRGAIFYHDSSLTAAPHAWGPVKLTAEIGRLKFYNLVPGSGQQRAAR